MSQQNTPTQIIEMIQKMNVPNYLQTKLNEYIGVCDNLKQRIININTSLNDYKNKVNQYNNMDKRKKEAKQLLNELKQTHLIINNEKQAIQNDKELLRNNLLLLIENTNRGKSYGIDTAKIFFGSCKTSARNSKRGSLAHSATRTYAIHSQT